MLIRKVLLVLLILGSVSASELQYALEKAGTLHLSQSRYWHLLLHMPDGSSEIDDPAFFLSKNGKHDASAELKATLAALYNETRLDDNATGCRYPARREWLRQTLGLEALPEVHCSAYDALVQKMDPQSVTLVFSAAHVNSPASMFGHTFLRIDSSYESKMLSYAINYAAGADPDKENGVVFAIKGLFGGYPGFYSLLPYYEKLKEYRDTEQRDVWEYDLDFTRDEVMAMVRHIWELRNVYNWYYFFDENCSYNMFWLMEIARPDARLREQFTYHVIPMETVHATEKEGLVSAKHYRPSKRTILLAYEKVLDRTSAQATLALADGTLSVSRVQSDTNLDLQTKRYMFEAASELLQYRLIEGELKKSVYQKRLHTLLSARAALGRGETVPVEQPANPDEGHRATRAVVATGWRDGSAMQTIGIRPAYHDLSDSDVGFLKGTQIEFLDLLARYYQGKIAVEKATLISIVSVSPISRFFTPFSWRTHAGWGQNFYTSDTVFSVSVGAGAAAAADWGYGYLMLDPEFFVAHTGVGAIKASAGTVLYVGGGSKLVAEGGYRFYSDGQRQWLGSVMQTIRLGQNDALKLSFDYADKKSGVQRTFMLGYNHYY